MIYHNSKNFGGEPSRDDSAFRELFPYKERVGGIWVRPGCCSYRTQPCKTIGTFKFLWSILVHQRILACCFSNSTRKQWFRATLPWSGQDPIHGISYSITLQPAFALLIHATRLLPYPSPTKIFSKLYDIS